MTDLLLAAVALTALVAVGLAVLAALTVVPFMVSLQLAEARRFSPTRWGTLALAGSVFGLAVAALILRADSPTALAAVGLLPMLACPALLKLLPPGDPLGGRTGRHT